MAENEKNPIEKILDENNCDTILLYDEEDRATEFEQIAVIPMDDSIFVILLPITHIDGVEENKAIVFVIDEIDEEPCLTVVTDDELVDRVFAEYEALCPDEE